MPIRIRTRLLFGYIGGLIILLIVGSIGVYSRHILLEGVKDAGEIAREIDEMQKLSLSIERLLMPANDYLISGDINEKENYNARLMDVMEMLARIAGSPILMEKEKMLLDELKIKISVINTKAKEIFNLSSPKKEDGSALMYSMDKTGEEAYAILNAYADIDRKELDEVLEKNRWAVMFVNYSMLIGGLAVTILGIFMVFYIERSVRLPIETLSNGIKELNGARWEKVMIKDGLEITTLAGEYNRMVDRLKSAYEGLEEKVRERTKELYELNKKLEVLSVTDGLTGLYNHRYFYQRLNQEIQRALRYNKSTSLIIMDIDYFKNYNDRFGHLAGDDVLRGIAECVRTGIRNVDIPARYGGEEFSVILPEIDKDGAVALSQRLREIVAEYPFPRKETQPNGNLTISIGVANFPSDAGNADALVITADKALYFAKEKGRNRVEAA